MTAAIVPHSRNNIPGLGTNYTRISTATFNISFLSLLKGINIFGVTYDGPVTITVPFQAVPEHLIYVNRESGTGTITITGV